MKKRTATADHSEQSHLYLEDDKVTSRTMVLMVVISLLTFGGLAFMVFFH